MAGQLKIHDILPEDYGYVILAAISSIFVNVWMMINVARARKLHKVKYPTLYSPDNDKFNCVQRVHQHTLENFSTYLFLLLVGGLQYPRVSAGAALLHLVGRIAFALGYYTGDPEKRRWGSFGEVGLLCLIVNTISFALHLLKWL